MPRHGDVVGLARAQHDEIAVEGERHAVPDEAIETVAEQGHLGHHGRVAAGRALGPANVGVGRSRKVRVQRHAQQAALGVRVHRQVEHRCRLQHAADHALDLSRRLLEHQVVVDRAEEDDADRLADAGIEDGRDLKVRVEQRRHVGHGRQRQRSECGAARRPRPSPRRCDAVDAREHRAGSSSRSPVGSRRTAATPDGAQDRRSLRAPRDRPRDQCRQADREQRRRRRLGDGADGDGDVVDAELQLRQVVGFGEAKAKQLAAVRPEHGADVAGEGAVAADQRIAHLRRVQRHRMSAAATLNGSAPARSRSTRTCWLSVRAPFALVSAKSRLAGVAKRSARLPTKRSKLKVWGPGVATKSWYRTCAPGPAPSLIAAVLPDGGAGTGSALTGLASPLCRANVPSLPS